MYERGNINTRAYWNMRYASGNYPSAIDEFFRRIRVVYDLCEGRVLDVGCGEGLLVNMLATGGHKAVGVDFSEVGLLHGRKNTVSQAFSWFPEVGNFVRGDAHSLPFGDSSFDTVVAAELLEHVDNHIIVISELKRVCCCGGRVIISVPRVGNPCGPEHIREVSLEELQGFFSEFEDLSWVLSLLVTIFWGRKVS